MISTAIDAGVVDAELMQTRTRPDRMRLIVRLSEDECNE